MQLNTSSHSAAALTASGVSGERRRLVTAENSDFSDSSSVLRKTSIIDAVAMHVDDGVTVSVTFAEKRIARNTGTGLIRH